jgi:hypothetical protein
MPRSPNEIATELVTLSTTPQVMQYLRQLVREGTFGKTPAEAAERLVSDAIERLIRDGTLRRKPTTRLGSQQRAARPTS